MRHFTLLLFLILFSLHLEASEIQPLYDKTIKNNQHRWIKQAIKTARKNQEPDHHLEILKLDKKIFDQFIKTKEEHMTTSTTEEWKKHAIAILLSFYIPRKATQSTARDAAWSVYDFLPSRDARKSTAYDIAMDTMRDAVDDIARPTLNEDADSACYHMANKDSYNAAYDVCSKAVKKIKVRYGGRTELARVAHQTAQMQVWITILDPRRELFKIAYDRVYSKLDSISEQTLNTWFASKEVFKNRIHWHLIEHEYLTQYSRPFLRPLFDHLTRIAQKIFPEDG